MQEGGGLKLGTIVRGGLPGRLESDERSVLLTGLRMGC